MSLLQQECMKTRQRDFSHCDPPSGEVTEKRKQTFAIKTVAKAEESLTFIL
jgi:hypothetical protein